MFNQKTIALCIFFTTIFGFIDFSKAESDYIELTWNNSTYHYNTNSLNFFMANTACNQLGEGWHLAFAETPLEASYLAWMTTTLPRQLNDKQVYIGGIRATRNNQNRFIWFDFYNPFTYKDITYDTMWLGDEPEGVDSSGHCLRIGKRYCDRLNSETDILGGWNAGNCLDQRSYICENESN